MQTYIFFGNNHLQAVNFIKYLNQPPKSPIWGTFVLYHVKSPLFGGLGGGCLWFESRYSGFGVYSEMNQPLLLYVSSS
jgi:hypothetical protein